jgi:hypothetical protein
LCAYRSGFGKWVGRPLGRERGISNDLQASPNTAPRVRSEGAARVRRKNRKLQAPILTERHTALLRRSKWFRLALAQPIPSYSMMYRLPVDVSESNTYGVIRTRFGNPLQAA